VNDYCQFPMKLNMYAYTQKAVKQREKEKEKDKEKFEGLDETPVENFGNVSKEYIGRTRIRIPSGILRVQLNRSDDSYRDGRRRTLLFSDK